MDWETLKALWPVALVIGGHVARTEASRAVLATRVKTLEDRGREDRAQLERQLARIEEKIDKLSESSK